MRVRIDLTRDSDSRIIYPDNAEYFTNVIIFANYLEADYSGQMNLPPAEQPITNLGNIVTKLAFKNRFKDEELEWMELMAVDNISAEMSARLLSAKLRVFLGKLSDSTYINLARYETIAGVNVILNLMKDSPLLSGYDQVKVNTRIQEILNTPVTAIEVPTMVK